MYVVAKSLMDDMPASKLAAMRRARNWDGHKSLRRVCKYCLEWGYSLVDCMKARSVSEMQMKGMQMKGIPCFLKCPHLAATEDIRT